MSNESTPFQAMATRIDHGIEQGTFGGAAVIVPPNGAIPPIEILLLDPQADVAQFLATIATRIQVMLKDIENQQRMQQGYGVR
jgi:hypothetical protein